MNGERERLELNGVWRVCPDLVDEGEAAGYWRPEHEDRLWNEAAVPGTLAAACPGLAGSTKPVWFRRRFTLPGGWTGKRLTVCFEGVNDHARVWMNGVPLGANDDPFLPFTFEFTPVPGTQVLVVSVENEPRPDDVPGAHTGWRRDAGILRGVRVEASDFLRLESARLEADPATGAVLLRARVVDGRPQAAPFTVQAEIEGPGLTAPVRVSLTATRPPVGSETTMEGAGSVPGCRPWSPSDPALYTARFTVVAEGRVADSVTRRFGFRRIEVTPDGLLLNGKPLFLTGFNRHEDSPGGGMAEDPERVRKDLAGMKEAGANFIRLCHYPHSPLELDLCDELGLAALAEAPLYFWNNFEEGRLNEEARVARGTRQLKRMIERDAHHPGILIWSVSNETEEGVPEVRENNRRLIRLARSLDSTRLAVHVADKWRAYPNFEEDDLVCINCYNGLDPRVCGKGADYDPARAAAPWRDELAKLRERYPSKPILVTEFGGASIEGTRGHFHGEDRHAQVLEADFAALQRPYVCGAAVWCWADHPWPPGRFYGGLDVSPYGVLTLDRQPKAPFHVIRRLFRARQGLAEPAPGPLGTGVVMVRPHMRNLPEPVFPDGFGIRPMGPDDAGLWTDIQADAEPYIKIGRDLFRGQFGNDPALWARRCFILTDPRGLGVGTISAWFDRDFHGEDYGRIHWVSVRRACQGKGLGRAGLAYAMREMAKWHDKAYLVTSTERVGAIKLYLDFGFAPDLRRNPGAWKELAKTFSHPLLAKSL